MDSSASSERIVQTPSMGQLYQAAYDDMLGNSSICAKVTNFVSNGLLLTVLVVGCVGAAHVLPAAMMGWILVGLGLGYIAVKLLAGECSKRKIDLIYSALISGILIVFGSLGVAGVLTAAEMGYALIPFPLAVCLVSMYVMIYAKHKKERLDAAE